MITYPGDIFEQDKPGRYQDLREIVRVDALGSVSCKIYAAFCENFYGIRRVRILIRIEIEVKLPGAPFRRYLSLGISQGDSELDELQDINVAAHRLVMIIR